MVGQSVGRLVGLLVGRLVGLLVGRLVDWLVGWLVVTYCVDLDSNRLQKAKEMGADCCIQVSRDMTAKDIAVKVKEYLGDLATQTIECTGAEPSICAGIYVR